MLMPYPVQFSVDYPDRKLSRWSTAFRIFAVIPIGIVLGTLGGWGTGWGSHTTVQAGGVSVLFLPVLLMIVFRQKYPRWWFDWNLQLARFGSRVGAYLLLMDDRYPSTDDEQGVHLDYQYPDVRNDLNRWLPLVKWFLGIPHYIMLAVLTVGMFFAVAAAWFAILFTGRYPSGLFNFVQGVMRWGNRVGAYAFTLVTDEYPPFRLAA